MVKALLLPMQGTQVQSLVGKLRSHMPRGVAKKKRKRQKMEPFFWDFFFSWLLGNQTNTKKI